MSGEGEKLRAAREMKAWSLNDVEKATKIRARYLEALETEQYEIIPGIAYVKGFLQTYAKQLDLDPVEILSLYKSSQVSEKKPPLRMPFDFSSRPLWKRPVAAVIMAVLVISAIVAISYLSPHNQTPADSTVAPLPTAPVEDEVKDTDSDADADAATSSNTPSAETQPATPSNSLDTPATEGLIAQLVFNERCWLSVKADGKPYLEGEYSEGTTKEIKASDKIEFVTVGNAGGLSVTLNGTLQPSLGRSGQVVNNIVLTKDSVNAR